MRDSVEDDYFREWLVPELKKKVRELEAGKRGLETLLSEVRAHRDRLGKRLAFLEDCHAADRELLVRNTQEIKELEGLVDKARLKSKKRKRALLDGKKADPVTTSRLARNLETERVSRKTLCRAYNEQCDHVYRLEKELLRHGFIPPN